MRESIRAVTCAFLTVTATQPAGAVSAGVTLEQAVRCALDKNPEILSLGAQVDAGKARLDGASRLLRSNPAFEGGIGPRTRSGEGTDLDLELRLSQSIEIAGQRGARIDATSAALEAAEANLGARRNDLIAGVKERFARALAASRRSDLAREARVLAGQAQKAAEERSRAGAAGQIEVNTARIEVGRAAREQAQAEREHIAALGELRLLLAWDPSADLELLGNLAVVPKAEHYDVSALIEKAKRARFELIAARRGLEVAKAEENLADRKAFPDLQIGATYAREESAQIILGTLGIDLPLFDRNQAARGVSTARVVQAERALEAVGRRVEQEVRLALARHASARTAADAYAGEVVTALEQNLELANEAYRAGKFDFFQLMLIRRETLDARRGYIEALEELATAEAEVARAVGSQP